MDIEQLISDVTKREAAFENLIRERAELRSETASLKAVIKKLSDSEKRLNMENKSLRDALTNLEESFLRKYDYKNECSELRNRLSEIEAESKSTQVELQNELQKAREKLIADERLFKSEAEKRQEEFEVRISTMMVERQTETQNIMEKGHEEQKRLDQTIRTKDAEISKLQIEYDAKMKRMQEHIMKLQNNASSNHSGTEIFRKKLKHERDISSKRIAELESQISNLRSQLADSNKMPNFIAGYSRHIVNAARSNTSKRRKLN